MILGGVTHYVLEHADIPVLMAIEGQPCLRNALTRMRARLAAQQLAIRSVRLHI